LEPRLRDALLGKAKALSYLERHTDALTLLHQLVELGQWYLGDVYFWRDVLRSIASEAASVAPLLIARRNLHHLARLGQQARGLSDPGSTAQSRRPRPLPQL